MFDFLKNFFVSSQERNSEFNRSVAESTDNLDIQVAITAHENWKLRLKAYLTGKSSEVFDPAVICFDDRCDLGKWIHGPGQEKLGKYPGFTALMNNHKMFHYAASSVVALHASGKSKAARQMLDVQFSDYSNQVVGALKALRQARGK
jgi:hypothetical protein